MYLKYLYIFRTPKPAISQMGGVGVTSTIISLPPTSGRRTAFILPGRVVSNKSILINVNQTKVYLFASRNLLKSGKSGLPPA